MKIVHTEEHEDGTVNLHLELSTDELIEFAKEGILHVVSKEHKVIENYKKLYDVLKTYALSGYPQAIKVLSECDEI